MSTGKKSPTKATPTTEDEEEKKEPVKMGTGNDSGRMGGNGPPIGRGLVGRVEGGHRATSAPPRGNQPRVSKKARVPAARDQRATRPSQLVGGQRQEQGRLTSNYKTTTTGRTHKRGCMDCGTTIVAQEAANPQTGEPDPRK